MADDNDRTSDDSLLPAAVPSRRRKRRKKSSSSSSSSAQRRIITGSSSYANLNEDDHVDCWRHRNHNATTTISNNNTSSRSNTNCDALDAELENQVNQLMTLQRSNHQTKRKRHVTISANDDHTTNYCADKEQVDNTQKLSSNDNSNMSSALPILLHIREIGLSSSSSQLHRRYNNNQRTMMTLLLHQPPAYSSRRNNERRDKQQHRQQQCSDGGLNLDATTAANHHSNGGDDHSNNIIARRLRVPIPNRHVLHHNDNDNGTNYQDSTSKEASTLPFYKQTTSSLTWRPYTQQTIPFSTLNTPHSVAILAMDQWGGYSIGMAATADGGGDGASCNNRDGRRRGRMPSLSLNFYGIPSPARLLLSSSVGGQQSSSSSLSSSSSSMMISPLVHSIPLLLQNNQYNNNNHSLESNDEAACYSPVVQIGDIPIQILLCSNGAFGVGYVLDSRTTTMAAPLPRLDIFSKSPALQDDFMGTLVIFETPRDGDGTAITTKSFHCCNVRIGGWKSFTMRNALWPTMYVPVKSNATSMGSDVHQFSSPVFDTNVLSAHMLFNDEDDGFRITWINPFKGGGGGDYAATTASAKDIPLPSHKIQAARNDIVMVTNERETWEECLSDPRTGLIHPRSDNNDTTDSSHTKNIECYPQLDIPYEVYLHIDALLLDILARRQQSSSMFQMSPYQSDTVRFIPNFYYNLISVSEDGLDVTLVIVFSNKEKMMMQTSSSSSSQLPSSTKKKLPAALGVVITLCIFNQTYDELEWVQHPSCEDDSSMKQWCNSLALNWRMKECGVGVFCLEQSTMMKNDTWVGKTHERNVDEDLEDDYNIDLWGKYCIQKEEAKLAKSRRTVAPPKDISMSSLYPHCDVITNRAVYDAIPVKRISSRKSPTDLIYG